MKNPVHLIAAVSTAALVGCGTPVVTQTTAFVSAGKTIVSTVQDAQNNNLKQENGLRDAMVSTNFIVKNVDESGKPVDAHFARGNGQCGFRYGRNPYLRYVYTSLKPEESFLTDGKMLQTLKDSPYWSVKIDSSCTALLRCEQAPFAQGCNSTCYSEAETPCIDAISGLVAKDQGKTTALDQTRIVLSAHSYPLLTPIESDADLDALSVFSSYLGLLSAAATPQPTKLDRAVGKIGGDPTKSIADNASDLAKNVERMRSRYNSAQSHAPLLPKMNGISDTRLTGQLGAIGQLLAALNEIAETENSAREIKDILADPVNGKGEKVAAGTAGSKLRWEYIDQYIKDIGQSLQTELQSTNSVNVIANLEIRSIFSVQYMNAAPNADDIRYQAVTNMKNYPLATIFDYRKDQETVAKDVPQTIASLVDSHDKLVQLIFDPNSDDNKQKFISAVENLKNIVQAFAGVISAFK